MKLQFAMDRYTINEAIKELEPIQDLVDIVEVGTPMLLRFGLPAVAAVRKAYPDMTLLCDAKIMDGGSFEADCAFEAGANIVTVMGVAYESTISGVIGSAKKNGGKTFVDMMKVPDPAEAATRYDALGADYICIHNASDVLDMDMTVATLEASASAINKRKLVIAGGINPTSILRLRQYQPEVIVVGHAVVKAQNKREMILSIKKAYAS